MIFMKIDKKVRELYPDSAIDYDEMADDVFNQIQDDDYQEPVFDQSEDFVEPINTTKYEEDEYLGEDEIDIGFRENKYKTDKLTPNHFLPKDYTETDNIPGDSIGFYDIFRDKILIQPKETFESEEKFNKTLTHENIHKTSNYKRRMAGYFEAENSPMTYVESEYEPYIYPSLREKIYPKRKIAKFIKDDKKNMPVGEKSAAYMQGYPDIFYREELYAYEGAANPQGMLKPQTKADKKLFRLWFD